MTDVQIPEVPFGKSQLSEILRRASEDGNVVQAPMSPKAPTSEEMIGIQVSAIVDKTVADAAEKIAALRGEIDRLEQRMIISGAKIKAGLQAHIKLGRQTAEEVDSLRQRVAEMEADFDEATGA